MPSNVWLLRYWKLLHTWFMASSCFKYHSWVGSLPWQYWFHSREKYGMEWDNFALCFIQLCSCISWYSNSLLKYSIRSLLCGGQCACIISSSACSMGSWCWGCFKYFPAMIFLNPMSFTFPWSRVDIYTLFCFWVCKLNWINILLYFGDQKFWKTQINKVNVIWFMWIQDTLFC